MGATPSKIRDIAGILHSGQEIDLNNNFKIEFHEFVCKFSDKMIDLVFDGTCLASPYAKMT